MEHLIRDFLELLNYFPKDTVYLFDSKGTLLSSQQEQINMSATIIANYLKLVNSNKNIIHDQKNNNILQGVYFSDELFAFIVIKDTFEEATAIAKVLKDSLEIKLLYENNGKEDQVYSRIVYLLLNLNESNKKELSNIFKRKNINLLNYQKIIAVTFKKDMFTYLKSISNFNDLFICHDSNLIFIFNNNSKLVKDIIFTNNNNANSKTQKIYVGDKLKSLEEFKRFYKQVNFIKKHFKTDENIVYVKEYTSAYLLNFIPQSEILLSINHIISSDDFNKEHFLETFPSLIRNNYNVAKTGRELFLHKNTVHYRLKSFEHTFSMDLLNKEEDRFVVKLICFYYLFR